MTGLRNIDELLFHMPAVAQAAEDTWARGFAVSIMGQSKRRNWKPSDKQLQLMRRMVVELFIEIDEPEMIEDLK